MSTQMWPASVCDTEAFVQGILYLMGDCINELESDEPFKIG